MFLKKIEIRGFKSFADHMVIHFDDPVTGVVGPNGCGKSNISDAIRWVLDSPFAHEDGGIRPKNIVIAGDQSKHNCLKKLANLGFKFTNLADNDQPIDLLFVSDPSVVAKLPADAKLVWFRTKEDYSTLKAQAEENNQFYVEDQCLFGAAKQVRANPKHD